MTDTDKKLEAAMANLREAWAALAMSREAVETLAPSGAVKAAEHLDGPTFMHEAEALVAGIMAIAAHRSSPAATEGCGSPGCTDPGCDYGKGPLRCQSCGAIIASKPSPAATVETKEQRDYSCTGLCNDGSGEGCNCNPAAYQRSSADTDEQLAEEIHRIAGCQVGSERCKNIINWYRGKVAALTTNEPQGAQASAWRVCWVSLNTSRTELFEDEAKAAAKAREVGGCVIPLGTLSLSRPNGQTAE